MALKLTDNPILRPPPPAGITAGRVESELRRLPHLSGDRRLQVTGCKRRTIDARKTLTAREAIGELRRFLVDGLRRNDVLAGDALLQAMDDIYALLVTIDYPDGMTGGLRRTTDVARGILEKTRGDLTVAVRQDRLERQLRAVETQVVQTATILAVG